MTIELEIFFVDLVGYYKDPGTEHLWALMPKAHGHVPLLVYFTDSYATGLPLGDDLRAQLLYGKHLSIKGDSGNGVQWDGFHNPNAEFPLRATESARWVTKMDSSIHHDIENWKLHPDVFKYNSKAADKIYSRFFIRAGDMKSERFNADNSGYMIGYLFPKGDNLVRAMVGITRLVRSFDAEAVTLEMKDLATGNTCPDLELQPDGDGRISCVYMNFATLCAGLKTHFPAFAYLLDDQTRDPKDFEPDPKCYKASVNESWRGILRELKDILGDEDVLKNLSDKVGRAVFTNPTACPQCRYK